MMRVALGLAGMGLTMMSLSDPASAQVARFNPALQAGVSSPLLAEVQFTPGERRIILPGGQPGMRPHGPGSRMGGIRGGGPGVRADGGPRQQFGGGLGRRFDAGDYGRRRGGFGIGAGVAGLAAGALIGGAITSQAAPGYGPGYGYDNGVGYAARPLPPDEEEYAQAAPAAGEDSEYCAQQYRSYDSGSGTYLGFDGLRHTCP